MQGSDASAQANGGLTDAFRHHFWASRELLGFCEKLPAEKLGSSATGTYGGVVETFDHLVVADLGYAARLSGARSGWLDGHREKRTSARLADLSAGIDEAEALWQQILAKPADVDRVLLVDKGENSVRAGVFIAQALHHGTLHREQICSIITSLGMRPPDLQAWEYAWASGRIWKNADSAPDP
jgi:uncharacterized damage-inducible protein DinB